MLVLFQRSRNLSLSPTLTEGCLMAQVNLAVVLASTATAIKAEKTRKNKIVGILVRRQQMPGLPYFVYKHEPTAFITE